MVGDYRPSGLSKAMSFNSRINQFSIQVDPPQPSSAGSIDQNNGRDKNATSNSLPMNPPGTLEVFSSPPISPAPQPDPIAELLSPNVAADPITRQILRRRKSPQNSSRLLPPQNTELPAGTAQRHPNTQNGRGAIELGISQDTVPGDSAITTTKEKRKNLSLLSRIIGNRKIEVPDKSENTESVPELAVPATEVFSRPVGFIPHFPAPPSYIRVRGNRKQRDFERVFLAQVLQEKAHKSRRRTLGDEEIVYVNDALSDPGQAYSKAVWAMKFSLDGRYLAAAGQDKTVRVWAVISSREDRAAHEAEEEEKHTEQPSIRLNAPVLRTKLVREYHGHTASILDLSWSKNNFLLSSSMDKTVRLWHVSRDECLCAFKHHDFVTSIAFHPRDDRFFLAGSLDSKLRLWSIPDKSLAYWVNVPDMVTAVAFTPDGKTCIAGCLNGLCLFYDTEGLRLHSQLHVRSARGRNAKGSKITGIDTITFPPGDPAGNVKLLITSNDSRIRMYNYKDRNLEIKFRGNENTCSQIHATFSDDGQYVICGSEDKKVYIWPTGPVDMRSPDKRPMEILEAHSAIVTVAILAPANTRRLLAQSEDPIYDLCNPPQVSLVGDGSAFSHEQTESNNSAKDQLQPQSPTGQRNGTSREARQSHMKGNIVVTADYLGQIKILRQDCAFQKRRFDLFDSSSVFSKNRLLGRSGTTTARTSISSARNSDNLAVSKSPSTDRILTWRNSITEGGSTNGVSSSVGKNLQRARSNSPRKDGNYSESLQPLKSK